MIYFDRYQVRYQKEVENLNQVNQRIRAEYEQLKYIESSNNEIRSIRHDMKNNMNIVTSYIRAGKLDEALAYAENLIGEIDKTCHYRHIGQISIDAIINKKLEDMKKYGIEFKEYYSLIEFGRISCDDIAIIIACALDNAIEASRKVDENPYISLSIVKKRNYIIITIINSIIPGTKINFKKTSKADTKNHGFGMKKLTNLTQKYDGDIQTDVFNDRVELRIILPING